MRATLFTVVRGAACLAVLSIALTAAAAHAVGPSCSWLPPSYVQHELGVKVLLTDSLLVKGSGGQASCDYNDATTSQLLLAASYSTFSKILHDTCTGATHRVNVSGFPGKAWVAECYGAIVFSDNGQTGSLSIQENIPSGSKGITVATIVAIAHSVIPNLDKLVYPFH
jgi:hypothetical protein